MKKLMIGIIVLVIGAIVFAQSSSVVPYISTYIRTLLNDSNAATARTTLGAEAAGTAAGLIATHNSTYDHNDIGTGGTGDANAVMVTHLGAFDHNDIATALQPSDIRSTVEPYGAADANIVAHNLAYTHSNIAVALQAAQDANSRIDALPDYNEATLGESLYLHTVDSNEVMDVNETWLSEHAGSGDANTVMATHLSTYDHNDISAYHYYSFVITDPNSYYDSNNIFPVDCNVASALSLLQVKVSCDKNPATELDLDLKYATNETLAGATLISALDTTAGKSTTSFTSSVAATKFFYIQFGARPDATIDFMRVDIKCSTNEFDFTQAVVVEPNECYDVNTIFPVDYCFNAATISQIQFKCDINPTNEPNITLYYGDAQTGSGTKICDIDTTDGKVTVNSFTDATVTAGSDIWGVWNARPDADIKWEIIKIARTDD